MRGTIALLVALLVGLAWWMDSYANGEADKADRCREAGGTLIKTVDFSNGTICARIEEVKS